MLTTTYKNQITHIREQEIRVSMRSIHLVIKGTTATNIAPDSPVPDTADQEVETAKAENEEVKDGRSESKLGEASGRAMNEHIGARRLLETYDVSTRKGNGGYLEENIKKCSKNL